MGVELRSGEAFRAKLVVRSNSSLRQFNVIRRTFSSILLGILYIFAQTGLVPCANVCLAFERAAIIWIIIGMDTGTKRLLCVDIMDDISPWPRAATLLRAHPPYSDCYHLMCNHCKNKIADVHFSHHLDLNYSVLGQCNLLMVPLFSTANQTSCVLINNLLPHLCGY